MTDSKHIQPACEQSSSGIAPLLQEIAEIIQQARSQVRQAVNQAMVQCYWQIGCLIVEHEQHGNSRAAYGKHQLQTLSSQLTAEFGKGFDVRNLRNMRAFYLSFPIWNAVRTELRWTHYRILIRLENTKARDWYLNEAIEQNWSVRALDRQINKLYYERLLSSQDSAPVAAEANRGHDDYSLKVANLPDAPKEPGQMSLLDGEE